MIAKNMPKHRPKDQNILEMALIGLEVQKERINAAIAEIRARLDHRGPGRPRAVPDGTAEQAPMTKRKRTFSAAARKRIGEATRKRWAALRKAGKNPKRLTKIR
jgi:hypothetical protein